MRKIIFTIVLLSLFSMTAFAATYKINSSGKVTTPNGHNQSDIYKNYSAGYYTTQSIVSKDLVSTVDIVMDYSGSMEPWINIAERTMAQILSQIPPSVKVGLRVFGQQRINSDKEILADVKRVIKSKNGKYNVETGFAGTGCRYIGSVVDSCTATRQVAPILSNNTNLILTGMKSTLIGTSTPLVYGLYNAVSKDFGTMPKDFAKKIILITDGGETCGGDACAFAKELMKVRQDIHIDVVLVAPDSTKLICLANTTGGNFYIINNLYDFPKTILDSLQSQPKEQTNINKPQYEFIK